MSVEASGSMFLRTAGVDEATEPAGGPWTAAAVPTGTGAGAGTGVPTGTEAAEATPGEAAAPTGTGAAAPTGAGAGTAVPTGTEAAEATPREAAAPTETGAAAPTEAGTEAAEATPGEAATPTEAGTEAAEATPGEAAVPLRPEVPESARQEAGELPRIDDAGQVAPKDARELSKLFFERLRDLPEGTPEHRYARDTLIEMNLSLVHYVAGRFRNRGNGHMEDIVQVGTVGLIKAIDRYDVDRGSEFVSFAVPCVLGEIKRYFRDTSWAVHVPRRLQELRSQLAVAQERLSSALGREPTVKELAADLGVTEEQALEGIMAANGYAAGSLDAPQGLGDEGETYRGGRSLADVMGDTDPAIDAFEHLHALAPLLADLPERERRIIEMRFGQEMTQAEIGALLGISQMHVSRLLSRTLLRLREGLLARD